VFRVAWAESAPMLADASRVRQRVYCEEERLCSESRAEAEHRSSRAGESAQLVVYAGAEAVGTLCLGLARPERGPRNAELGFELEANFELSGFERPGLELAEVRGFCVLRRFRGTAAVSLLFGALLEESRRRGVTHWLAAANTETDSAEDASIALGLARAQGLVSSAFQARARAPSAAPEPARRPIYDAEERRRAKRGELRGLRLPRTLALFGAKMGARYIGEPVYHRDFNVFALPLVAELAALGPGSLQPRPLARTPYDFGSIAGGVR
jgi:hypothetical protein